MTRMMKLTIIAIAAFFLLTVLSFLWFVATWDPDAESPVVAVPAVEASA